MIDFLYSFLLFWAGTLLLLGYAVVFYAAVVAIHYIFKHDQDKAIYNNTFFLFSTAFPLKIFITIVISCGLVFLYAILSNKPMNDIEWRIKKDIYLMILVFSFFFFIGLNVYFIDKEHDYYDFSSYFLDKKFLCALLVIPVLLFVFYLGEASRWLRGGNAHKMAKCYIVAGQNLQYCKWLLTTYIHPEIFLVRPITALQQVMFRRAERLIPDDDAEAAAWENRWFHSHYTRNLRVTLGDNFFAPMTEKEHPGSRFLIKRWWHCLEVMGDKPLQDEQVKREIYLIDYARLAYIFYYMNIYPNKSQQFDICEDKCKIELYHWLAKLMKEWKITQINQQLIYNYPEEEVLAQVMMARIIRDILHEEIKFKRFDCSDDKIIQYLSTLQEFHAPKDGKKSAYRRLKKRKMLVTEDIDAADTLYRKMGEATLSWPSYAIEQYCGIPVPGRADYLCHWPPDNKRMQRLTPEQCADKVKQQDKAEASMTPKKLEQQMLEEIFHGK